MRSSIARQAAAAVAIAGLLAFPLFVSAAPPEGAAAKPYLGVAVEPSREGQPTGVLVREVDADGPAGKAGLKEGDRIEKAGDKDVKSFDDLKAAVAAHKVGEALPLKVMRDGKEQTLNVTLAASPEPPAPPTAEPAKPLAFLGIRAVPLTPEMKDKLGVGVDKGVVVAGVLPGSPADKAGLKESDVITQIGGAAVTDPRDFHEAVQKVGVGKEAVVKVVRGKQEMELKAELKEFPGFPDRIGEGPDGFERFPGRPFGDADKAALEKRIDDLEKRVQELEKKLAK